VSEKQANFLTHTIGAPSAEKFGFLGISPTGEILILSGLSVRHFYFRQWKSCSQGGEMENSYYGFLLRFITVYYGLLLILRDFPLGLY
jgi:hypothetical protein